MTVLEQISQMQQQGFSESEIIRNLQEQGVSPKTITDALSQAQIKQAVSAPYPQEEIEDQEMNQSSIPEESQEMYSPQTQEMPQDIYAPQRQNYSEQEYSPQEEYSPEYPQSSTETDTIIEIAEQVFSEKIKDIEKKVDIINEFATLAKTKIQNNSERIKRIETTLDKLQLAILDKVGEYGKDIELIKKEMSMIGDSFSKVFESSKKRK